ncbi:unnamed protein product [Closterium sp. Naga37s-1]|nr:unnamed protein product [Closterium sp. Naga37s-1]
MGIWSSRPAAAAEGEAAVAEAKPKGLNLDDHVMLKRHLDEVATDIIISRGYEEDHTLSNVKMVICAAACAVACVAQFYPRKFPDNRALLLACIVLYPPRRHPPPSLPALPSQFHAPAIPPCCPFHQSPTLVAVPRSPVACLAHRLPTLLTAPTPDSPPPLATHALPSPWPLGLYPPAPPPLRPPPLLLTRPLMDSCCLPSVVAP